LLLQGPKDVDARDKRGHDGEMQCATPSSFRDGAQAPDPESRRRHDAVSGFRVRVLAHAPRNDEQTMSEMTVMAGLGPAIHVFTAARS
jgi:hypothetical protein